MSQTLADFHVNGLTEPAHNLLIPNKWYKSEYALPGVNHRVRVRCGTHHNIPMSGTYRYRSRRWERWDTDKLRWTSSLLKTHNIRAWKYI